jgi:hypothetical protein
VERCAAFFTSLIHNFWSRLQSSLTATFGDGGGDENANDLARWGLSEL